MCLLTSFFLPETMGYKPARQSNIYIYKRTKTSTTDNIQLTKKEKKRRKIRHLQVKREGDIKATKKQIDAAAGGDFCSLSIEELQP